MNKYLQMVRTQTIGPSKNVLSIAKHLSAFKGRTDKVKKPVGTIRKLVQARKMLNQELKSQGTLRWMEEIPQIPPIHTILGSFLRELKQYLRGARKGR